MLKTFIERPVLSTVISIIIVVLGIIGIVTLPISQYPDIAPPTVQVSAVYSGADAQTVMNSVVIPLEEQINGVEGMTHMTSSASNSGMANVTIYFRQGIDPDMAVVNVQALAAKANATMPQEVINTGVTVRKQQSSNILMMSITSDNKDHDGQFIQNYANINILPQIKRVQGVGDANVFGARDYAMRIWLKPDVMASYNISPAEVIAAIGDQNIEAAPGQLGQNSEQTFQYTLKYTGRLQSEQQFEDIVIRSSQNEILWLKDIADVELGSLNYTVSSRLDGKESVTVAVSQTAGSNAQALIEDIKAELAKAGETFPPGFKITYLMDANEFLSASISKVITTLLEAFVLVFLVVLIFLQGFRSTIIPAISVPVAIVGTFFFLQLFGFTINLLTLFGLILAIGIVVDDAIVVVEAVHAQLDAGVKSAREATELALKEIAPAIISITLVMAAVFVPVSFIGGSSGVFYKQFGLTLAISIMLSAVNALTLSPALCALFLKPHEEDEKGKKKSFVQRFYYTFNVGFEAVTNKYKSSLQFLGRRRNSWITVAIIVVSTVISVYLMRTIPTGFVPNEDSGSVMGMITLPPGSSLERSDSIVDQVVAIAQKIEGVNHVANITGVNFQAGLASSYASIIIKLHPWDERKLTADQVVEKLKNKTDSIQNATFFFFGMPTLPGFGLSAGVDLKLQDKTGGDIQKFDSIRTAFVDELRGRKEEIMMVMSTFDARFPQKLIEANIPKIKDAGLTLTQVMSTLQAYIGSMYVSKFNIYGKQFWVVAQSSPEYRKEFDDLSKLYIPTASGAAPITEFLTITPTTGPQTLNRFNLYTSMDVTIIPNIPKGYSTGDVINIVDEMAKDLPLGYGYEYSGMTREEVKSGGQTIMIFGLCIVFVYLLLAALYESYILPLAVLASLPIGLAGVFIFIFVALVNGSGIVNNIYVQISIIMLIGLLSKNAILIIEYAIQRRKRGMSIVEAGISGAVARLRPILMTSFAFIFGLMPLMFASGAGAIGNRSIGISAIGGMFVGTMIGVLVIPSLFIIFQYIQEKISKSSIVNHSTEQISESNE